MQAVKQYREVNPLVVRIHDMRGRLKEWRDASEETVRDLDKEIALLKQRRRQELEKGEGFSTLLGETDDGRLAERLTGYGWQILD